MPVTSLDNNTAPTASNLRKSLAVLLLGIVAFFASFESEHLLPAQDELSGTASQTGSLPSSTDFALLLHKETLPYRALISGPGATGEDDDKKLPDWLSLVRLSFVFTSPVTNKALPSLSTKHYISPQSRSYSSRAPPRF